MSNKNDNKSDNIDILYNKRVLCSFPLSQETSIKDLKNLIQEKYSLNLKDINLSFNEQFFNDDTKKLLTIIKNNPKKLILNNINTNFKFCQMENESNIFNFNFDLLDTTIDSFKKNISDFFKQKMDEFNFNISKFEFFDNNKPFFDETKSFQSHFKDKDPKFYFLIKDCEIHFNSKPHLDEEELCENQENNNEEMENKEIELRSNVKDGTFFKIIIQTYNHLIKEIEVFPEMTIDELKNIIEKEFMVSKEHQELLYLVYKLDDDSKKLKDYYIRPQGIIFLRGYYFPLIFVDYFDKKNKNIICINIAEKIKCIKSKITNKLNLDGDCSYKLLLNGKTLNDNDYLINFNVQKMQLIYFK